MELYVDPLRKHHINRFGGTLREERIDPRIKKGSKGRKRRGVHIACLRPIYATGLKRIQ
jgi:hypothetical protein